MLVMAAVNGFFSGRGQTWTSSGIEAFGTAVNVALALVLIFGRGGFPEMGIEGARAGRRWSARGRRRCWRWRCCLRQKYRGEFATLGGWRPERELFGRLMKYGGPAGMQVFLDVLVFHLFAQLVGRLGEAAMGATTLTVRLNMIAFLPMMGLGQAICILVGQRLGENRPGPRREEHLHRPEAGRSGTCVVVAVVYLADPERCWCRSFEPDDSDPEKFAAVAAIVPTLLLCVAIYSLADAVNLTFAFALRGAGDTRFVTLLTFCLAWPIMVMPTYAGVSLGGSVYWAGCSRRLHIIAMAVCFWFRFRSGKWKTMRVIEPARWKKRERRDATQM